MPPKVLTAGALRAWSVYGEINVKGLGSTLALLRTFNIAGIRAGKTMRSLMGTMQAAIKVTALAGFAFAALAIGTTRAFGNFDAAMNQSLAIMGNVSDVMRNDMSQAARMVGKTTSFSAKQAAEGYFFLASAGMNAAQSLKAMPAVANFAQAGMFNLATATDLSTDALSALGLKVHDAEQNLENLVHVTDVLTGANTLANATVEQFSLAITNKLGGRIRVLGKDMEEATAVLASFADQGVKGRIAGQRLTIIMRDLPIQAIKNEAAFKKLGIEVFDSTGKMNHMADILGDMEDAFLHLAPKQRIAAMMMLGLNKRASDGISLILGQSEAIRTYDTQLRKMGGITAEVANKQLAAFNERIARLKDLFTDLAIEIGSNLAPMMLSLSDGMKTWVEGIDANALAQDIAGVFAGILRGIANVMEGIGNMLINVNMSMTQFMGIGMIGFFILGPLGFALFTLIAVNVKKLLHLIAPGKFKEPFTDAEKAFEKAEKAAEAASLRLIGLRRFFKTGTADVSLFSDEDKRFFATLQDTFATDQDAFEHFEGMLLKDAARAAEVLDMAAVNMNTAFEEGNATARLWILTADGLRTTANLLGQKFDAASGATGISSPSREEDEKALAWLPASLFPPDLMFEPLEQLTAADVPTDHIMTPFKEKLTAALAEMGTTAKRQAGKIGRSIINGIIDGSLEMKDVLKMVLSGILNVAMGGLFGMLGIGSPSKLTMGIGRNIGEGLAIGMMQTQSIVTRAAMGLGTAVQGGFARTGLQSALSGPMSTGVAGAVAANAAARGAVTVNVKGMSKPMTPREAARDAMWQDVLRESVIKARKDGFRI